MSFLSSFSNTRPVPRVFKSSGIPSVFQVLLKIYHGPSKVLANFLMTFRCKFSSRCCLPSSAVTDGNFSVPSHHYIACSGHNFQPLFKYRRKPAVEHIHSPQLHSLHITVISDRDSSFTNIYFLVFEPIGSDGNALPVEWCLFYGFSEFSYIPLHNRKDTSSIKSCITIQQ